jgi:hypothetical protein
MLRVLVREAKSSGHSHSGYYHNEAGLTGNSGRFVTITSRPVPESSDVELLKVGDDRSDRSILGNQPALQGENGIVQVTDITVKFDEGPRSSQR